jgi:hypothetical protein
MRCYPPAGASATAGGAQPDSAAAKARAHRGAVHSIIKELAEHQHARDAAAHAGAPGAFKRAWVTAAISPGTAAAEE